MTSMLEEALREIGYTEDPPGSNRTKFAAEAGHAPAQPWCATFVVAMARRANVHLPSESAYTPAMAQAFKTAGLWTSIPHPGDVAFFDFPDSKDRIQHVGIVESTDPVRGTVTSIEGNTSAGNHGSQDNGGGVYRRTRPLAHAAGFGHLTSVHAPHDEEFRMDAEAKAAFAALDEKIDKALNSLAGFASDDHGKRDTTKRSGIGRILDHFHLG